MSRYNEFINKVVKLRKYIGRRPARVLALKQAVGTVVYEITKHNAGYNPTSNNWFIREPQPRQRAQILAPRAEIIRLANINDIEEESEEENLNEPVDV